MAKCTYVRICKHYSKESFTCDGGNKDYCGKFRLFQRALTPIKVDKYLFEENYK